MLVVEGRALLGGEALARPDVQDQRQPTVPRPLSLRARPWWRGLWHCGWRQACPPLSESQAGPLLCPVITSGRFVCACGKRDTSSTSSPGFLQPLTRCTWGGGGAQACYPEYPQRRGGREAGRGAGRSRLDWMSQGGEDRTSCLGKLGLRGGGRVCARRGPGAWQSPCGSGSS